jgi:hypothetical protein
VGPAPHHPAHCQKNRQSDPAYDHRNTRGVDTTADRFDDRVEAHARASTMASNVTMSLVNA